MTPTSLSELFNKDPETLTDEEIGQIVDALAADRERWVETESKPKRTPKQNAAPDIKLEDLDL